MLRLYGKVKVTKLISEHNYENGKCLKVYSGFAIKSGVKSNDENPFISFKLLIYGRSEDPGWDKIIGNWLYGEYDIIDAQNNSITLKTKLSSITSTAVMVKAKSSNQGNNGYPRQQSNVQVVNQNTAGYSAPRNNTSTGTATVDDPALDFDFSDIEDQEEAEEFDLAWDKAKLENLNI